MKLLACIYLGIIITAVIKWPDINENNLRVWIALCCGCALYWFMSNLSKILYEVIKGVKQNKKANNESIKKSNESK